jgi:CHAT domain-containing protein/tetratricopeptide (TPR) repeat protein
MRNYLLLVILFFSFYSVNTFAQEYSKLVKADSLAQRSDFEASINLINGVLNENPRNFLKAQAFYQLSYIYLQLYEFEKAKHFNEESQELRDMLHYEFIADNYMLSGAIELAQNNLEKALTYFLEAKELPHSTFQFSGKLDGYIAVTYKRLGKPELALKNYQSSLEILDWELGSNDPQVAEAHFNLGEFFASIQDYTYAILHFKKSISIELNANRTESSNVLLAKNYNAIGVALYKETLNIEDAIFYFKKGLFVSSGLRRLSATARLNIAEMLFLKKEFVAAGEEVFIALQLLHIGEVEDKRIEAPIVVDKYLYFNALRFQSAILLEAYLKGQNKEDLLKAYESSVLTVIMFDDQNVANRLNESELPIINNYKDVYEQAIHIGLKLYKLTSDFKYQQEAFQFAEQGKAMMLNKKLIDFSESFRKELSDDLRQEEQHLHNQFAFFETDIAFNYKKDNFYDEAMKLKNDYQILLEKIERTAPKYFDLKYRKHMISFSAVQKGLSSNEGLLSYYQGKDMYYIFAINNKEIKTFAFSLNAPVSNVSNANNHDLISEINTCLNGIMSEEGDQYVAASRLLYQRLVEPIKSIIKNKNKLIIIPHRDLHFLAFETLLQQKPKDKIKYNKLDYLIRDYAISYEMSADLMLKNKKASKVISNTISAWAPVFDPKDMMVFTVDTSDYYLNTFYNKKRKTNEPVAELLTFEQLGFSEKQVESVFGMYTQKKLKGDSFIKANATEEEFKREAKNYKQVHIVSHSFTDDQESAMSCIILAPSVKEDGILTAREVMNIDFRNTDLVVMSHTNRGAFELIHREGLLSLNQAFLFAGVDNMLTAQWENTDERYSQELTQFYKKALEGKEYPEALRYAKLKMIKKSNTATPKIWAGLHLTGS